MISVKKINNLDKGDKIVLTSGSIFEATMPRTKGVKQIFVRQDPEEFRNDNVIFTELINDDLSIKRTKSKIKKIIFKNGKEINTLENNQKKKNNKKVKFHVHADNSFDELSIDELYDLIDVDGLFETAKQLKETILENNKDNKKTQKKIEESFKELEESYNELKKMKEESKKTKALDNLITDLLEELKSDE